MFNDPAFSGLELIRYHLNPGLCPGLLPLPFQGGMGAATDLDYRKSGHINICLIKNQDFLFRIQ